MNEQRKSVRYGFETFDCAPALRLEAHERIANLQFASMNTRLEKIEALIERLEKRLWFTVYGVVAVVLSEAVFRLIEVTP